MLSERGSERLSGAFLVLSFVLFLAHLVTLFVLEADLATILLVFMYGFLVSLSGVSLYLTFRPHGQAFALFGAFGFTVHGLFVVLACAHLLAGFQLPQELAAAPRGGTESMAGAAVALDLAMDRIRASGFMFLGLGMAALGVLIVRSGAVARSMGWFGIVGGAVGFFGFLAGISNLMLGTVASVVTITVILGVFAFILILGVRLLARETIGEVVPT